MSYVHVEQGAVEAKFCMKLLISRLLEVEYCDLFIFVFLYSLIDTNVN